MTSLAPKIEAYEPLNTLKPIADGAWLVDGPIIHMRFFWRLSIPFSTRMTLVRLDDGALWVHSPTELTNPLKDAVDALGPVRYLVAPNKIHYWWVGDWQRAYPDAIAYAAPGVETRAKDRNIRFDHVLEDSAPPEWAGQIDQRLARGKFLTEAVFYHRASRTLILADLIENFEPDKVHGALYRQIAKWSGVLDPHGSMPRDLRMTFRGSEAELRDVVRTMMAWDPARIIIAHGRWYEGDAQAEVRRAFAWVGLEEEANAAGNGLGVKK